jgi:hypothetical protein
MGSITAGYASGKEVVAAQIDRDYARSAPENMRRNTLKKIRPAFFKEKKGLQRPPVLRAGSFLLYAGGN